MLTAVLEETGEELIEGCRRGDPEAFRILFETYKDRVYSVALRYSGNASLAQDIAQETFVKLFTTIGSFRGDARFESWLYRLVVNSCFDHKRRTRRLMPLFEGLRTVLRAPSVSALDEMVRNESSEQLQSIVATLPPEQRMMIVLRYTQGLSYDEIAEIMGCSAGTVGSRLNRLHKLLETRLSRLSGNKGNHHV
ncbi:MAG TPA: sigma-70 family RNA polymerase sigma factor [Bryobacteraceae bacterium]|jgi:RNA polymerase sigma-70 factor (ECF subfamily)|nr:sigma-70 family RNA polymerase sigma factor [Bryobacteraceae bacterium]